MTGGLGIGADPAGDGGFGVSPEALRRQAAVLDAYRDWAARLHGAACRAEVDPVLWGPVGAALGLPERYRALSGVIGRHLAASVRFLESAAAAMAGSAGAYRGADAGAARDLDRYCPGTAAGPTAGRELLDGHDLHAAFPVAGRIENGAAAVCTGQYGTAIASCLDLGVAAFTVATDPLAFLCSAGLGYLVSVLQPVEDLLGLVTGNADRIGRDAQAWQHVADGLAALAGSLASSVDRDLAGWSGLAANAARDRLFTFAVGVRDLSGEVAELVALLQASRVAMDAARALILEIVSALVEWMVVTWLAAQAASVVSLGASEVAAMTATLAETDSATVRAAVVVHRVEVALVQVEGAFAGLARRVLDAVPERLAGGSVARSREVVAGAAGRAAARAAGDIAARTADGLVPAAEEVLGAAFQQVGAAARQHAVRAGLRDGFTGGAASAGTGVLGGVVDHLAAGRPPAERPLAALPEVAG